MVYGNLPGGGFKGFIKADEPLDIEKPSFIPLKQWPPGIEYQKVHEEKESLSKKAKRKIIDVTKDKKSKLNILKLRKDKKSQPESKDKKYVHFDDFDDTATKAPVYYRDTREEELEKEKTAISTKGSAKKKDSPFVIQDDDDISLASPESSLNEERETHLKFRTTKKKITFTYLKRKRSVLRFSPCLDRLMYSQRLQYKGLKAFFGFPIGAAFGFALYWFVLDRMGGGRYLCWILGIFIGIGFALSTQIRCICLLSIPICCGRAGRTFISTYVISYVITGPLANILANSRESMRVVSCTASLNLNHSMERFNLMFKPIKEIILEFVGAGEKIQEDTKRLDTAFEDIENEIKDEDEVKQAEADIDELDDEIGLDSRVNIIKRKFETGGKKKKKPEFGEESEKKYGMKSEFRCEEVFTKGVRACYNSFQKAYDRCHSYLPIIGYLLCWPMKLTFICDLVSSYMGKRSCDSDVAMNPGFGASVDTASKVQSEFEKDFSVQLQYKLTIPEETADQLVPEDISGAMMYSFERRKRNLDFFTNFIDRMLAVLCLLVFNASRKYCNQYLRTIQFDNKYVTAYFRHVDGRRRQQGKSALLPLKKGEKLELFEPFAVKFSGDEKVKLTINGLKLMSEVLTVSILLAFDWIFYEFLDLLRRHGNVTYKQTGVHHINMTVYGDGFVGKMVRSIVKGFDKKHTVDQVTTTEACLPVPTKLSQSLTIRLYLIFLLMLILIIAESYALRLRRVICSFFYPKREKKRIIFLYNDRLKKRRSYLQHMRHKVRKQARAQAIAIDSGIFFSLRMFHPKYFNWLSKLGFGLACCLICGEKESKKLPLIACPGCPFSCCHECYQDTGMKCYACLPDDDTEPSEDSLSEE